ncbi:MAG: KTSC domain-containing protein [Ginsengibacter sp.]
MDKELNKRLSWKNLITTPKSDTTTFINYDKERNILEVRFADGVYHYFNVPPQVWEEYKTLVESGGSSGKFINFIIKPYYKYQKLED